MEADTGVFWATQYPNHHAGASIMKTVTHLKPVLLAGLMLLALAACQKKDDNGAGPAEQAGRQLDQAATKATAELDNATTRAKDELDKAARISSDKLDKAGEDAGVKLNETKEKIGVKMQETGQKIQDSAEQERKN
jgi:hypothetical protein